MFGPALNSPFSNKKNDPYNKLKNNARIYLNKYFARTNNKATINNANRNMLGNIKAFAESNPRQAAVAGAAAAAASPAAQPAVTAALLAPRANSAQSNAESAGNAGGPQSAVAAAVETARQNGNNAGAAAGAAAAANSNNAKSALKAINWSSLNNAGRNAAINRLRGQFPNKFNGMTNNGLNNYQRSILVTIKTKRPPALPPKPVAAPVPSLMNASIPGEAPRNVAPSPNSPFRSLNKKMANGQSVWAPSSNSQNYYAKKNNSTNNYYKVVQSIGGSYIYSQAPNNKNKPFTWSKNSKRFDPKFPGGFGELARQALVNARAAPPAARINNAPKNQ
jgi:hypothetical protein